MLSVEIGVGVAEVVGSKGSLDVVGLAVCSGTVEASVGLGRVPGTRARRRDRRRRAVGRRCGRLATLTAGGQGQAEDKAEGKSQCRPGKWSHDGHHRSRVGVTGPFAQTCRRSAGGSSVRVARRDAFGLPGGEEPGISGGRDQLGVVQSDCRGAVGRVVRP